MVPMVVWSGHLSGTFAQGTNGLCYLRERGQDEPLPPCQTLTVDSLDHEAGPILVGSDGTWMIEEKRRAFHGFDFMRVTIPGRRLLKEWAYLEYNLPWHFSFLGEDTILYSQDGFIRAIDTWGRPQTEIDAQFAQLRYDRGEVSQLAASGGLVLVEFRDDKQVELIDRHGQIVHRIGASALGQAIDRRYDAGLDRLWLDSKYRSWLFGDRLVIYDLHGKQVADVPVDELSGRASDGTLRGPVGVSHDGLLWVLEFGPSGHKYYAFRIPGTQGPGLAPALVEDQRTGLEPLLGSNQLEP